MRPLLSVDIGNSTIGFGLFPNPLKSNKAIIRKVSTHPERTANSYKKIVGELLRDTIKGNSAHDIDAIISSVVPRMDRLLIRAFKDVCCKGPMVLDHKTDTGITFDVPHPEKVGPDRIANAVAGYNHFKRPVAIVDFGTATTITIVGKQHKFLGGAILPGLGMMRQSLHSGTARLPLVPVEKPETVLGKDTPSSLASGIVCGTAGAVETLIAGMEKELHFRLQLIITGGHCGLMSSVIKRACAVAPDLTFEGLRLIYLNQAAMQEH